MNFIDGESEVVKWHISAPCVHSVLGGRKRVSEPPELVASCCVNTEKKLGHLREEPVSEPSSQPLGGYYSTTSLWHPLWYLVGWWTTRTMVEWHRPNLTPFAHTVPTQVALLLLAHINTGKTVNCLRCNWGGGGTTNQLTNQQANSCHF